MIVDTRTSKFSRLQRTCDVEIGPKRRKAAQGGANRGSVLLPVVMDITSGEKNELSGSWKILRAENFWYML